MFAWKLCAAVAATALFTATVARADDAAKVIVVESAQAATLPGSLPGVATVRGDYWLGLFASRPSPALQAQLKLPKDQGLLVEALQPNSPAAKAGVQPYDILLKGNDKPLTDLHDLMQLVDQVKDGKLTLDLLRAGKHETVTVTPAKRPANEPAEMGRQWFYAAGPAIRGFSRNFGPDFMEGGPLEFHVIHPGQILPPGGPLPSQLTTMEITVHATSNLADGSKVEITRHAADPAEVVVTHDKDKWEGTSKDLSKIPEKIRPEVEKLLHPAFDHLRVLATTDGLGGGNAVYFGGAAVPPGLPGPFKVQPDVENRLSELQKQVDELRRSVDALQGENR